MWGPELQSDPHILFISFQKVKFFRTCIDSSQMRAVTALQLFST